MAGVTPVRRIRNEFELQDLVDSLGRDSALVEQDFALMTIAAGLVAKYGDALCFKGGFVLRHVHGHERFSKDIDATRINPPKNKLDSADVAKVIRDASMRGLVEIVAEKLRALAQRDRPTDLSDLAMILTTEAVDEERVRELVAKKFELVRPGNHRGRIEETIARLGGQYDDAIRAVAPDAPAYEPAAKAVLSRLASLLP